MLGTIAAWLTHRLAPQVILIVLGILLACIGATSCDNWRLERRVGELEKDLASERTRAQMCEDWRNDLARESERRRLETAAAIQAAQAAVKAAEKRVEMITAPLTSTGVCERLLEVDARVRGSRQ